MGKPHVLRNMLEQRLDHLCVLLILRHERRNRPRTARILNVFGAFADVQEVVRQFASRAPQIDLKNERVLMLAPVSYTHLTLPTKQAV